MWKELNQTVKAPTDFKRRDWRKIFKRLREQIELDNVGIVAPGVAFFAFLGIFPLLAAFLSFYGLVASSADVAALMEEVQGIVPGDIIIIFQDQLVRLTMLDQVSGWAALISTLFAIWSGSQAVKGMMVALNIAYGEREKRSLIRKNAVALGLTFAGLLSGVVCVFLLAGLPALLKFFPLGNWEALALRIARWVLLALIIVSSLSLLYRWAPCRRKPLWRWITPGSGLATVLWLFASALFFWYVANFANFNKMYGSLGAIAMLLAWLSLSAFVFIMGAELDSEIERQAGLNRKEDVKEKVS